MKASVCLLAVLLIPSLLSAQTRYRKICERGVCRMVPIEVAPSVNDPLLAPVPPPADLESLRVRPGRNEYSRQPLWQVADIPLVPPPNRLLNTQLTQCGCSQKGNCVCDHSACACSPCGHLERLMQQRAAKAALGVNVSGTTIASGMNLPNLGAPTYTAPPAMPYSTSPIYSDSAIYGSGCPIYSSPPIVSSRIRVIEYPPIFSQWDPFPSSYSMGWRYSRGYGNANGGIPRGLSLHVDNGLSLGVGRGRGIQGGQRGFLRLRW
jgi:hypothetical protein